MPASKKPLGFSRIGRVTILREAPRGWLCRCDCGKEWVVTGFNLRSGRVQSCGCYNLEKARAQGTHRRSKSRAYKSWSGMIQRCTNPKNPDYSNYGGRGIAVCERWKTFENFYADMGNPPAGASIDRYPNRDGNYEPANARWATAVEQGRNTRRNRLITIRGETKPLSEWCAIKGIKYDTAMKRLQRGWTLSRVLEESIDVV